MLILYLFRYKYFINDTSNQLSFMVCPLPTCPKIFHNADSQRGLSLVRNPFKKKFISNTEVSVAEGLGTYFEGAFLWLRHSPALCFQVVYEENVKTLVLRIAKGLVTQCE